MKTAPAGASRGSTSARTGAAIAGKIRVCTTAASRELQPGRQRLRRAYIARVSRNDFWDRPEFYTHRDQKCYVIPCTASHETFSRHALLAEAEPRVVSPP